MTTSPRSPSLPNPEVATLVPTGSTVTGRTGEKYRLVTEPTDPISLAPSFRSLDAARSTDLLHHPVQVPAVGDALELVLAGVLEAEAGSRDQDPSRSMRRGPPTGRPGFLSEGTIEGLRARSDPP